MPRASQQGSKRLSPSAFARPTRSAAGRRRPHRRTSSLDRCRRGRHRGVPPVVPAKRAPARAARVHGLAAGQRHPQALAEGVEAAQPDSARGARMASGPCPVKSSTSNGPKPPKPPGPPRPPTKLQLPRSCLPTEDKGGHCHSVALLTLLATAFPVPF